MAQVVAEPRYLSKGVKLCNMMILLCQGALMQMLRITPTGQIRLMSTLLKVRYTKTVTKIDHIVLDKVNRNSRVITSR